MTDRILTVETPPLWVEDIAGTTFYKQRANAVSEYRPLTLLGAVDGTKWVSESKLDLSGYRMKDLTVYFRNSFEQRGGGSFGTFKIGTGGDPLKLWDNAIYEVQIITSVPMTDSNLTNSIFGAPGFTGIGKSYTIPDPLPSGNFNRDHIIHGSIKIWGPSTVAGSDPLTADGGAIFTILDENIFSSLEPTAADCLYCYRLFMFPNAQDGSGANTGFDTLTFPANRVLMSITTEEEPELSYMMRLKRSYELANQV